MTLALTSERRLAGVHPDLVRVVRRAAEESGELVWIVLEGVRRRARQEMLVNTGKSQTMNSRHLTGHAVDLGVLGPDGNLNWDWPLYERLNEIITGAANGEGVPIEWGGNWKWKDGDHWQLPWDRYPLGPLEGGQVTT
jgi:peptidoglycan L-alanyl-D-glutamate endopeptidase CwlK